MQNDLFLIAINLTYRCNLKCAHCYMDADSLEGGAENELTTTEVKKLLSEIAERSNETMVVLTGGEPLLRRDLEELVSHGHQLGLSMVVGTNGVLLHELRVQSLKNAGALGIGISLDSLDPAQHDSFRGCDGSWEKTLAGMEACRKFDMPFQVHFSVTENNANEVPAMIDFTQSVGARVLNIFFLVCTGRGEGMSDITPQRYEQVLEEIVKGQESHPELIIRARCAPHFKRIAYQHDPKSPLTRAEGYEGGGCLAGIHYCRVTPEGDVTACPYIPDVEGGIKQEQFWSIWDNSATFKSLRNPELEGKCGQCEFQQLCGGCRARPPAIARSQTEEDIPLEQDLMKSDPWCIYTPSGNAVIQPLKESATTTIEWSAEAEQRLQRIPPFLRKMVKKRTESYVAEQGDAIVTPEHMAVLAKRRFGDKMPSMPDMPNMAGSSSTGKPTDVLENIPFEPNKAPASTSEDSDVSFAWTAEARAHLEQMPHFLIEGVRQVAEDVAKAEGRLEVNMQLLQRLEDEDDSGRHLEWDAAAAKAFDTFIDNKAPQIKLFVQPTMEAAAEREAKIRNNRLRNKSEHKPQSARVTLDDVNSVITTHTAGIEWSNAALKRVKSAPEFVRGGIKKAAEFNARREGLTIIESDDLTRFRNRAMMRAVRRMKGFGMTDLSFGAYDIAKEEIPRLQENEQAAKRFETIRDYVESRKGENGEGLGLMDQELLNKMKTELRENQINPNKSIPKGGHQNG